ncbi:unnamed protein product [Candidula unifasciata]|uniref:Ubiquitin-like domain-containing protein n=1 Tax=Candidula unifasciata TaxID=100452 RepID=A0A8S3YMW1_9EUPU|nr:unnamed protein product [Candidula unifasciata]
MLHIRIVPYQEAEAEQFIRIEFNFQISDTGTISIHMAECSIGALIGGLKEDLRSMFGDPAHQEWFHRTRKLSNDKTLKSSGIDGRDRSFVQIYVRQTNPDTWQ